MDKTKIQEFFKEEYLTVGKYEVINHDIHVRHGIVNVWANRINGCEHWTVTLELHECVDDESDTWETDTEALGYQTDEELIHFVKNFEALHYNEYFPLFALRPEDCNLDDEDEYQFDTLFNDMEFVASHLSESTSELIDKYFDADYVETDNAEFGAYNIPLLSNSEFAKVWAMRNSGSEGWYVLLTLADELSDKGEAYIDEVYLGIYTDDELIDFIKTFQAEHHDEYFPIRQFAEHECEANRCAYNCNGICKYAAVFGKQPVFDDENNRNGFCHNFT